MGIEIGDKIKYMGKIYELIRIEGKYLTFKNIKHRTTFVVSVNNLNLYGFEVI